MIFLTAGMLSFGFLFFAYTNGILQETSNPVATLTELTSSARQLPQSGLTRGRLDTGSLLSESDSISTSQFSSAKLSFFAGGELFLGPATLVVLRPESQALKVIFLHGSGRVRNPTNSSRRILAEASLRKVEMDEFNPESPELRSWEQFKKSHSVFSRLAAGHLKAGVEGGLSTGGDLIQATPRTRITVCEYRPLLGPINFPPKFIDDK